METVERTVVVEAAVSDVWDAITDDRQLSAWFGALVELDARPGGAGRFVGDDGIVRDAVVVRIERHRNLTLQWWPTVDDGSPSTSRVSFDLEPVPDGTRLTVTERAIVRPGSGGGVRALACA